MSNLIFPEAGYTPANLRALRKYLGLSQQEMAEKIGVNLSTLGRWEMDYKKKNYISMSHLRWVEILDLFNVSRN